MMKVELGELARNGLETRVGSDLPGAVNAALTYYVGKLGSGRRPVNVPSFLTNTEQGSDGSDALPETNPQVEVEVEIDERIEAVLYGEASRQGTTPAALARHAVLVYLAALDLIGEPRGAADGPQSPSKSHAHA
jgi:hypothetical protein